VDYYIINAKNLSFREFDTYKAVMIIPSPFKRETAYLEAN